MNTVLIVEDDDNKRLQLSQFVQHDFPAERMVIARSLQSGLRVLRSEQIHIVILDMTLPNYDTGPGESGGNTHPFGGREFLSQIDRFDLPVKVVVVTQFETFGKVPNIIRLADLDNELRAAFPNIYLGAVYYHAAVEGWQAKLKSILTSALGVRE
jgi:DNA-binding NarL/FixJ family response regulator